MVEKVNEQRGRADTLYMAVFTAIIATVGYVFVNNNNTIPAPMLLLGGLAGIGLATAWLRQVSFYINLIKVKLLLLQNMETRLQIFRFSEIEEKCCVSNSCKRSDKWAPLLFLVISVGAIGWDVYEFLM